jgi:phosphomannomutase
MKMLVFDIDGTLTKSKAPISDDMVKVLNSLNMTHELGILSGASMEQMWNQVISRLHVWLPIWAGPTSGASLHFIHNTIVDGKLSVVREQKLSRQISLEERAWLVERLNQAIDEADVRPEKTWGPAIEDREAQITWSALGQDAPVEAKATWDPDRTKRTRVLAKLAKLGVMYKGFSCRMGGLTSIDISPTGLDKCGGMKDMLRISGHSPNDVVYYGDAFNETGNDYPVLRAGVPCVLVDGPEDCRAKLESRLLTYF